jgi:tRNA modification GTPase
VFSTADTIVAIATPPGRGGIGVVRLAGPRAREIVSRLLTLRGALEPRRATFTRIRTKEGQIDQVVATSFPAPRSYTGDDTVELSAHGSPVVLHAIVAAAVDCGARLAEPGEFTLRAFLNGRIDLVQAEAVGDLIDAVTPLQARTAFDQLEGTLTRAIGEIDASLFDLAARLEASVDFPEEGFHFIAPDEIARAIEALMARTGGLVCDARRGRLIREGMQLAIVGQPNVGKSSVFNALVGAPRAIVAARPGTTRDFLTEAIDLEGFRVTLVDTAGLQETADEIEAEGIARSRHAITVADLVVQITDAADGAPADSLQIADNKRLIVMNKIDLVGPAELVRLRAVHGARPGHRGASAETVFVSAKTGAGMSDLRCAIVARLGAPDAADIPRDRPQITNVRHAALMARVHDSLARARETALGAGRLAAEEFVLADLHEAREALEAISGRRAPDEILSHIFSRFCVGK